MITEGAYQELIQNCVAYNSRLCAERRLRLPFLDSHTVRLTSFLSTSFLMRILPLCRELHRIHQNYGDHQQTDKWEKIYLSAIQQKGCNYNQPNCNLKLMPALVFRWKKKRHVISMAPPDVRLFRPAEMANFAEPIETVLAPNMFGKISL